MEKKLADTDETIAEMKMENDGLATRITAVESQVAIVRAVNENFIIQQDDLEQYGRRTNIRIEGIQYEKGETGEQLKKKIEQSLSAVGVEVKALKFAC